MPEKALADGSWVEGERVSRLCDIWYICDSKLLARIVSEIFAAVGIRVDNVIYEQFETSPHQDIRLLDLRQTEICRRVAGILAEGFDKNHVEIAMMQKT